MGGNREGEGGAASCEYAMKDPNTIFPELGGVFVVFMLQILWGALQTGEKYTSFLAKVP